MEFGNRLRDDAPGKVPQNDKAPAPGQRGAPSQLRAEFKDERKIMRALASAGYVLALMLCVATLSGLYALKNDALELAGATYVAAPRHALPFAVPPDRVVFDVASASDGARPSHFDRGLLRSCMPHSDGTAVDGLRAAKMGSDGREFVASRATKRGRYLILALDEAETFLACTAGREKQRFCHGHYRKRFAARLKELVSLRRLQGVVTGTRASAVSALAANQQQLAGLGHSRETWHATRVVSDSARLGETGSLAAPPRVQISSNLGRAITQLSRDGFLTAADFGTMLVGPPDPVATHMRTPLRTPQCVGPR